MIRLEINFCPGSWILWQPLRGVYLSQPGWNRVHYVRWWGLTLMWCFQQSSAPLEEEGA